MEDLQPQMLLYKTVLKPSAISDVPIGHTGPGAQTDWVYWRLGGGQQRCRRMGRGPFRSAKSDKK